DVVSRMDSHLLGILAEQFADNTAVCPGDVQPQFFADDAHSGLRDDEVDARDFGACIKARQQPLAVYRPARSGDADDNRFHLTARYCADNTFKFDGQLYWPP